MTPEILTMAANLNATMKYFARAQPGGLVREEDGLALVDAGRGLGLFNSALLTKPVATEGELSARAARAASYFRGREHGWCFWVCEGLIDTAVKPHLTEVFRSLGMSVMTTTPGLLAEDLRAPARVLPDVAVRPVFDPPSRQSFCHVMTLAFSGPHHQISSIYGSPRFWSGGFHGYLGVVDNTDVCAGAVVVEGGAIGIYALATLPQLTRKGYAEALLREMIRRALEKHGPLPLVLQSTAVALRLYRRLGFVPVTNFSVFTA